jgi:hypothetical protein
MLTERALLRPRNQQKEKEDARSVNVAPLMA